MIILGIIVALMVFVLLVPCGVHLRYSGDFMLWLSYGWLRFRLVPEKEKKNKKTKPGQKSNKPKKKIRIKLTFDVFLSIAEAGLQAVKGLLRSIRFKRFKLAVIVSGEDAASAAINYGRACAFASAAYPVFEKSLKNAQTDISVDLEYDSKTSAEADIIIRAMTLKLIIIAVRALFAVLPVINKKNEKGGASNERNK